MATVLRTGGFEYDTAARADVDRITRELMQLAAKKAVLKIAIAEKKNRTVAIEVEEWSNTPDSCNHTTSYTKGNSFVAIAQELDEGTEANTIENQSPKFSAVFHSPDTAKLITEGVAGSFTDAVEEAREVRRRGGSVSVIGRWQNIPGNAAILAADEQRLLGSRATFVAMKSGNINYC